MSSTVIQATSKAQPHVGEPRPSASQDMLMFGIFSAAVLTMPIWLSPLGAAYPGLMQKFAIFGIFAIGFNLLFGLTGYLSFGHAAFLGVGSYAAVWTFKLVGMEAIPAILMSMLTAGAFALLIGYVSLRRTGIYFSILTLAFAQMSYALAYSVLTPITNGETGLFVFADDPRVLDNILGRETGDGALIPTLLGFQLTELAGFYFCAVVLIIAYFVAMRIARSPFGLMLKAIKTNQNRLNFTGVNTRPYTLAVFVISGVYAGLAGALMGVVDPLAGAERMQWTASGEVVLMTILGGAGTLIGPFLGAVVIEYFENIFSAVNKTMMADMLSFLPDAMIDPLVSFLALFVGEGWHLTLGLLFMLVVIFLPGGITEGARRIARLFRRRADQTTSTTTVAGGAAQPGE